ncbi:exonuclease domain-containing protein [Ditylenchus destructor]|uniref:Exonuclease domain-containing protein n=1 Tax=Ditylenchus destructor TaxID=166010 RepID=A0AAD4N9F2_9BILA|nr:exonuclease domain-containing protein [Ditylenchus destructor]
MNQELSAENSERCPNDATITFEYFIVIDFECTCGDNINPSQMEIIEFPAILIDAKQKSVIDHFHSYVRPVINPQLTEFCTHLTGITQGMVSNAPVFPDVLKSFRQWVQANQVGREMTNFAFVTDGSTDFGSFLQRQFRNNQMGKIDKEFCSYINIRSTFWNRYVRQREQLWGLSHWGRRKTIKIETMLEHLGMEFQGKRHSGIDDSLNIAYIVIRMLENNTEFQINERLVHRESLPKSKHKKRCYMPQTEEELEPLPYGVIKQILTSACALPGMLPTGMNCLGPI